MTNSLARVLRVESGRRESAPPASIPAASPYEYFAAECQRRYQILLQAGIDEDKAIECAAAAAMDKVERLNKTQDAA
jgi:hypothetical protein